MEGLSRLSEEDKMEIGQVRKFAATLFYIVNRIAIWM